MKTVLVCLGTVLLVSFQTPARAGCPNCAHAQTGCPHVAHTASMENPEEEEEDHGEFFLDYSQELGLSDPQVAKLNKLRVAFEKTMFELHHAMIVLHAEISDLAHESKPNRRKMEAKADELGRMKAKAVKARFNSLLDARGVLTDSQAKKLEAMMTGESQDETKEAPAERKGT